MAATRLNAKFMVLGPNSTYLRERGGPPPAILGLTPLRGQEFLRTEDLIEIVNRRLENNPDERAIITIMKPDAGRPSGLRSVRAGQLRHIYNSYDGYSGIDVQGEGDDFVTQVRWARVVFYPDQGQPGGAGRGDPAADCLFRAIQRACGGRIPFAITCDRTLREKLGVAAEGPIAVDGLFEKLEALFPVKKFTCESDIGFVYDSDRKSKEVVRLNLTAGHFSLITPKLAVHPVDPKSLRVYQYAERLVNVWAPGIAAPVQLTREVFAAMKSNYLSAKYWFHKIERDPKLGRDKTPEEMFASWDKARAELMQATNGKLDIAKYGSIKRAAIASWMNNSVGIAAPEEMGPVEQRWVSNAMRGALVYGQKGFEGEAIGLDINSCYPAVLSSTNTIPLVAGTECIITEIKSPSPTAGFYRCVITDCPRQLFRQADGQAVYTHQDIRAALKLGGKVHLVMDGKPNAYLYTDTTPAGRTTFAKVFGPFIKQFYAYKLGGCAAAKSIMNVLTGALGERSYRTVHVSGPTNVEGEVVGEVSYGTDIDSAYDAKFVPDDEPIFVRGGWARVYPFIVARGREIMADAFGRCAERVVRIHTDGVYLSGGDIPVGVKLGAGLGEWKIEHEAGTYRVQNAMKVTKIK